MSFGGVLSCYSAMPERVQRGADTGIVNGDVLQIELDVQGFTHADRKKLLPALSHDVDRAGGWVLERRPTSGDTVDVFLEVQSCALSEVYGALLASGLELTRDSHRILAERCNCGLYLRPNPRVSSIVSIRLEVHFLVEPVPPAHLSRHLQLGAAAA